MLSSYLGAGKKPEGIADKPDFQAATLPARCLRISLPKQTQPIMTSAPVTEVHSP